MNGRAATDRGAGPWAGELGAAAVAQLGPRRGERILHAGCGTGELSLQIARMVGPRGAVLAVDPSAGLMAEAAEAAREEGLPVEFRAGGLEGPHAVGAPVHGVLLVRALSRGGDPFAVLAAAVAAAAPGGRVVAAEPVWAAAELEHPDPGLTRRVLSPRRVGIRRPGLPGELPALLSAAGLLGVRLHPVVTEARGRAAVEELLQPSAAALAPAEPDDVPAPVARAWWGAYGRLPDDEVAGRLPAVVAAGAVPA
ncbi:MAG: methyltransferase domain-containing protein [Thermoleophilia bacterium]